MADAIFQNVIDAHKKMECARSVFRAVSRVENDDADIVTARFSADDGGAWLLNVSGSNPSNVEMLYCVGDGGLPNGYVDDLCAFCFELDLAAGSTIAPALEKLLAKAAALYMKMNNMQLPPAGGSSVAAAGENSGVSTPSASPDVDAAVQSAKAEALAMVEQERAASQRRRNVKYKAPEFEPTPLATASLTKQLQLLSKLDTKSMGFTAEPVDDNLYKWKVELFFNDMDTPLARDLRDHPSHKHVEMEFRFPSAYPYEPPFCRIVAPTFQRGTGYVQAHGGICMELLTGAGWSPVSAMDSTILSIHSFLTLGKARLDVRVPGKSKDYTFEGALRDMSAIVHTHGWDVGNAKTAKPRKRARVEGDE